MSAIFSIFNQRPLGPDATNQSILEQGKTISNQMVQLASKVFTIAIKIIDTMGIYCFRVGAIGGLIGLSTGKFFQLGYAGMIAGTVLGALISCKILDPKCIENLRH